MKQFIIASLLIVFSNVTFAANKSSANVRVVPSLGGGFAIEIDFSKSPDVGDSFEIYYGTNDSVTVKANDAQLGSVFCSSDDRNVVQQITKIVDNTIHFHKMIVIVSENKCGYIKTAVYMNEAGNGGNGGTGYSIGDIKIQ